MISITDKEASVLIGITKSDFFENDATDRVYTWSVNSPYSETPSMGGIVASLTKKGLVESDDFGANDACIWLTEKGIEVLQSQLGVDLTHYGAEPVAAEPTTTKEERVEAGIDSSELTITQVKRELSTVDDCYVGTVLFDGDITYFPVAKVAIRRKMDELLSQGMSRNTTVNARIQDRALYIW